MTGYRPDEMVGATPHILQGPATDRAVLDQLRADLMAGRTFEGRTTNYRKDGTPFQLEWTVAPVKDRSGTTIYYVAIQRDVSYRQRLIAALREQAIVDPLTNCFNRRYGEGVLEAELARSSRTFSHLSVALIDIDYFKAVNDEFGHRHGDEVLRRVSDVLSGRLRANDTVCRWGGDEFLIIVTDTDASGARAVAEDLRRLIAKKHFPGGIAITVSVGVAVHAGSGSPAALIERADQALYQAKERGRNTLSLID
jgi:diguanylate cyclase (GGDEF)-like protein/PAS domain S-box-containing protein